MGPLLSPKVVFFNAMFRLAVLALLLCRFSRQGDYPVPPENLFGWNPTAPNAQVGRLHGNAFLLCLLTDAEALLLGYSRCCCHVFYSGRSPSIRYIQTSDFKM